MIFYLKRKRIFITCDRKTLRVLAAVRRSEYNKDILEQHVCQIDFMEMSIDGKRGQYVRYDDKRGLIVNGLDCVVFVNMVKAQYPKPNVMRHLDDLFDNGMFAIAAVRRAIPALICGMEDCLPGEIGYVADAHYAAEPEAWDALRAEWQAQNKAH
ncbi:MAG: hypothetical protein WCY11_08185 [Novosphingobium sp.]